MSKQVFYEKLMRKCFQLAKKGAGRVSPNPMVGAVIVGDDGEIISTGYHSRYGSPHAEQEALVKAGARAKGATLVVTLEPCNHYGKTPACADLIIEAQIKILVVAIKDPNPNVKGGGIEKCKAAGIEVIIGVLEKEAVKLNEVFFKNQTAKKPFVVLKTATTVDGRIATRLGSSKWITNEHSRAFVHKLRSSYDAILTGSNTVKTDNPSLTCRSEKGRSPVRIILDTNLTTPPDSKVYKDDGIKVILATGLTPTSSLPKHYPSNVTVLKCSTKSGHIDLNDLLPKLYELGITSILVEAGARLGGAFLSENLIDKFYHFTAPKILADNDAIPVFSGLKPLEISECKCMRLDEVKKFGDDVMSVYYFD